MKRIMDELLTKHLISLVVVTGSVVAVAFGLGTTALLDRFGWRAMPLLAVVMLAVVAGILAALEKLRELSRR